MFAFPTRLPLTGAKIVLLSTAFVLAVLFPSAGEAAEPEFVGVLALAVEEDAAESLGLSEETRQTLLDLIDRREAEAVNLALEIRSLPPEERQKRLAPFVEESERLGLALLTDQQQKKLQQLRIAREGLASLAEFEVAELVGLSDEQREKLQTVLQERNESMARGGENDRRLARNEYERRLAGVLTESQLNNWRKAAGLIEGEVQVAQAPAEDAASEQPNESPKQAAPADSEPADDQTSEFDPTADGGAPKENVSLRFNFRYAPWKDVIEWFAQQANLSVEGEAPLGTFNYTDNRSYTPAEALDLLNSVLLTKGYTLLRRDRMLFVVNLESLEDGIPPNLVTRVTPEELDERGEYEIVSVLFPLSKMTAEQAEAELRPLLGRPGELVVLPLSKQVWVTGTAGRLKTMRKVIQAVESPETAKDLNKFEVEHVATEEALAVVRKLMGIPEDANGAEDGSIRFSADPLSNHIYVSGQPDMIERFQQILEMVDVAGGGGAGGPGALETPQLEVYPITDADPTTTLQVLQTLLAGLPDVRLAIDPLTGSLIAMGRPSEHATIRATLAQLQNETRQIEVLRLYRLDPQLAVLSINRMFGAGGETPDPKAPVVDADPTTGMLLVRGTQTQIEQIKNLLKQMGESPEVLEGGGLAGAPSSSFGGNLRVLPFTGRAADEVLDQMELLWPTVSKNRIRIVRPNSGSRRVNEAAVPSSRALPRWYDSPNASPYAPSPRSETPQQPRRAPAPQDESDAAPNENQQPDNRDAARRAPGRSQIRKVVIGGRNRPSWVTGVIALPVAERRDRATAVRFAVERNALAQADANQDAKANQPANPTDAPEEENEQPAPEGNEAAASDIIVQVTPNGILVFSEDIEALNEFESLLRELYSSAAVGGPEYTVYYLKYIQASVAADLISQLVTGAPLDDGGGGAGAGLMGAMMGAALGDSAGGLVGNLLGGGSTASTFSATGFTVVPEPRLNALVVQATPQQLDLVEQLLEVIDQESSPEAVQTLPPPRMIPVNNTSAETIANTVRQIYAQQIASGGGQQRQPSPEDFIRALRGGGGRSGRDRAEQSAQQMTLSVDPRSNSIVVSAPDPLFQSVKALVEALDQPGLETPQATEVVSITGANASVVRDALTSILGDVVKTSTTETGAASSSGGGQSQQQESRPPESEDFREQFRRRIEMFNAMQRGGGDSGGDFRSRFGGGSPFGGFGGRSFGDRGGGDRGGDRSRGDR